MNFDRFKITQITLGLYYIACFVLTLIFVSKYASPVFSDDAFRHLTQIIIPLVEGGANWNLLWSNHHPTPILHLHEMFNLYVLRGNLKYDAYFGAIAQLITALIFARVSYLHMAKKFPNSPETNMILALVIGSISIALIEARPYAWPLISLQNYFLITGIGVAYFTFKVIEHQQSLKIGLALIGLMFFAMLTHKSYGSVFVVSAAALLIFQSLIYRDKWLFVWGLSAVAAFVVYNLVIIDLIYSRPSSPAKISMEQISFLLSYFTAFGKSVFNALHGSTFDETAPRLIFFLYGLIFALSMLWASLQRDRISIAAVLMIAIAIFGLASGLFRHQPNFPHGIAAQRYVLNYKIGTAAMMWVIFSASRQYLPHKIWQPILGVFIIGLIFGQILAMREVFNSGKYTANHIRNNELALYIYGTDKKNSNFNLPRSIAGGSGQRVLEPAVKYLVDNKLNVFHPSYKSESALSEYKAALGASLEKIEKEIRVEPASCTRNIDFKDAQIWELRVSSNERSRIVIRGQGEKPETFITSPGKVRLLGIIEQGAPLKFCFAKGVAGDLIIYE